MSDGVYIELTAIKEKTENAPDSRLEQELARGLYDREDVRRAGQEAFSKVSRLLIRYNRLKDAEKKRLMSASEEIDHAAKVRDKRRIKIEEQRQQLLSNPKGVVNKKDLDSIEKALEDNDKDYDLAVEGIRERLRTAKYAAIVENIDDDRQGGILSTLMLGGGAAGSMGYTLTSGDNADLAKGGAYIRDVYSEKGTLFEQMALLENAMTTSGVNTGKRKGEEVRKELSDTTFNITDVSKADWNGSSMNGAEYSLGDILRDISANEVYQINNSVGEDTGFDFGQLEKERKSGGLDDLIGKKQKQLSVDEAAEQRDDTDEAIERREGKRGGVNDLSDDEKKLIIAGGRTFKPVRGFFGKLFSPTPGYMSAKRGFARREALRAERRAWQQQMAVLRNAEPEEPELNPDDNAENTFARFNLGSTTTENAQNPKAEDKEAQPENEKPENAEQQAISELATGDKDKTARNMIAAYRLMGASAKELYDFRLALIAYLVPAGRKTLRQILTESAEAGFVGSEDLSSDSAMYATFAVAPTVNGIYINKFVPNKNGTDKLEATIVTSMKFGKGKLSDVLENKDEEKAREQLEPIAEASEAEEDVDKPLDVIYEEDEQEEENESDPLKEALTAYMDKNRDKNKNKTAEAIYRGFKKIFDSDKQLEVFDGVVSYADLTHIGNEMALDTDIKSRAMQIIEDAMP